MSKPKVLVVSSYLDTVTAVRPEAEANILLKRRGLDLTIISEKGAYYNEKFRSAGIRVIEGTAHRKFDLSFISLIRQVIRDYQIQIIHAYNNKAIINVNLAVIGSSVKVITYRGYTGNIHWYDPTNWLTHLHPAVLKIVCVSDAVRLQIRKQLFRKKDKAVTIYKGHDPAWYQQIEPMDPGLLSGAKKQGIRIGCVANARPMKGIPVLLEALKTIPEDLDWHVVLVGANMEKGYLNQLIQSHPNKSKIHRLGFQKEVLPIIKTFDIMVLPSIKGEGLSKTTIEAMQLAVPVIVSDAGGNAELVENRKSGIVVKAGDVSDLRDGLRELIQNAPLRSSFALHAKARVATIFHIHETVDQLFTLYQEMIQNS